jgi:hypothetical protein
MGACMGYEPDDGAVDGGIPDVVAGEYGSCIMGAGAAWWEGAFVAPAFSVAKPSRIVVVQARLPRD